MYFPQVKTTRTWGQRTLAKKCKSHQYKLKKDFYNIKNNFYRFIYINRYCTYVEGYFQQSYSWINCFTAHITWRKLILYKSKARLQTQRNNTYLFWNYYIYLVEYPLHCGRQSNSSFFFKNIFFVSLLPHTSKFGFKIRFYPNLI